MSQQLPDGAHVWNPNGTSSDASGAANLAPAAAQSAGQPDYLAAEPSTMGDAGSSDAGITQTAPLPVKGQATRNRRLAPTIVAATVGVALLGAGSAAAVQAFTSNGTPTQSSHQDGFGRGSHGQGGFGQNGNGRGQGGFGPNSQSNSNGGTQVNPNSQTGNSQANGNQPNLQGQPPAMGAQGNQAQPGA